MKKGVIGFIIGFCIGIVVIPISGFVYIELGCAPVATASSPLPLEKWAATTALKKRIAREAPQNCPIQADETNLVAGARIYMDNCAMCHGTMTGGKTSFSESMFPSPPMLLHGKGVTDDPVEHTYWKLDNGIRLSGMPSFWKSLNQLQMWQVSQMLANAHHLPAAATNILSQKIHS